MATSSGFYLFGRFCRELGPDVYNKHIFLEEHVKLLKCNSVRNAKDVGGNMMDSFLDDNALGPSPVDATDVSLRINLGPVDAAHVGEIGGATNPIAFNLSHSLFEECEEALRLCKKAGTLDLTPFNCIAKAVFAWLHGNHFDKFKASAYYKKYLKFQHFFANHTFSEMDFEVFRVLGRGGFGLVNGCRCIRTGRMYAMKTMDKRRVKMNKGEEMCCFEKELLACCNSRYAGRKKSTHALKRKHTHAHARAHAHMAHLCVVHLCMAFCSHMRMADSCSTSSTASSTTTSSSSSWTSKPAAT